MSTLPVNFTPPLVTEPIYRLSVKQYHEMIENGTLNDDDAVELLEGVLVLAMPKNPPHRITVAKLHRALQTLPLQGWSIQLQEPITLSDGEPEPDVSIVEGLPEDYPDAHPGPQNVPVIFEVSDTTVDRDRGIKLASYARAGIATYWIVNLIDRQVEVYTLPMTLNGVSSYKDKVVYQPADAISLYLSNQVIGTIKVADILP